MNHIHINLDELQKVATVGVNRTAVFMGLGINAALDDTFKKYQLADHSPIRLVPENADDQGIEQYKSNFALWIIGCGLRELIESFGVFLDQVYYICLVVDQTAQRISEEDLQKRKKKFEFQGTKNKLSLLKEEFSIIPDRDWSNMIVSVGQARNCLTHRQGIVGVEDCSQGDELTVNWVGLDIYAMTAEREMKIPYPIPTDGFYIPGNGKVGLKVSDRSRKFELGRLIDFSPAELLEICLTISVASSDIVRSVKNFIERSGITIIIDPAV